MSHHGSGPFDDGENERKMFDKAKSMKDEMRKLLDTASYRGATGDFPEGQLTKTDEGAIQFAVGVKDGKVVLDFGTPVVWVGLNPQQAADLASLLLKRAREAGKASGQPVGFTIG